MAVFGTISPSVVRDSNICDWDPAIQRVECGAEGRGAVTADKENPPPSVIFFSVPIQGG
jgi:hypothetical protein